MFICKQVLAQIESQAAASSAERKGEHIDSAGHVSFAEAKHASSDDGAAALIHSWEDNAADEFISALSDPGIQ